MTAESPSINPAHGRCCNQPNCQFLNNAPPQCAFSFLNSGPPLVFNEKITLATRKWLLLSDGFAVEDTQKQEEGGGVWGIDVRKQILMIGYQKMLFCRPSYPSIHLFLTDTKSIVIKSSPSSYLLLLFLLSSSTSSSSPQVNRGHPLPYRHKGPGRLCATQPYSTGVATPDIRLKY